MLGLFGGVPRNSRIGDLPTRFLGQQSGPILPGQCARPKGHTDEVLRLTPLDIQEAADLATVPQETRALLDNGGLFFEKTLVGKGGRRIPVEIHATTFQSGGRPVALLIIRDITERKRPKRRCASWPPPMT